MMWAFLLLEKHCKMCGGAFDEGCDVGVKCWADSSLFEARVIHSSKTTFFSVKSDVAS